MCVYIRLCFKNRGRTEPPYLFSPRERNINIFVQLNFNDKYTQKNQFMAAAAQTFGSV